MNDQPTAPQLGSFPLPIIGHTSVRDVSLERVGNKAYNLMRMSESGLPVPPAFVLTTDVCRSFDDNGRELPSETETLLGRGVALLEQATSRSFGGSRRPLLVSVRSGAAVSMPGMLDTILNIGLCDVTLPGLLRATGDPMFVWDSYRRFIQTYAEVVDGCRSEPFDAVIAEALTRESVPAVDELDVAALRIVAGHLQDVYHSLTRHQFPQDPMAQLRNAVESVLGSWWAPRAVDYRRLEGIDDTAGTAVTVQSMVFGNMGMNSGSGVGFTRDPASGDDRLYVDFLLDAQGEDIVAGRNMAGDTDALIARIPGLARQLQHVRRRLEGIFHDAQDFEFTVENGVLWMLQTRSAKRTPLAALRIASDLVDEGLIDPNTALQRLDGYDLDTISTARLDTNAAPIGCGVPAGTGVVSGRAAFTIASARRLAARGDPVILLRGTATTDDIAGLAVCAGLVTTSGARTSHAAVVARQLGVVTVVGCREMSIDLVHESARFSEHELAEGELITVDGDRGLLYEGQLAITNERPTALIERARAWHKSTTARQGSTVTAQAP
jgi:pyruvate,orthophosphate dikinase